MLNSYTNLVKSGIVSGLLSCFISSNAFAQQQDLSILTGPPDGPLTSPTQFNLPCYGLIRVSWNPHPGGTDTPSVVFRDLPQMDNVVIPSSPSVKFGPDVKLVTMLGPNADWPRRNREYRLTIRFLSGPPDLDRLQYIVHNLGKLPTNSQPWSGALSTITPNWVVPVMGANFTWPGDVNAGSELLEMPNGVIRQAPANMNVIANSGVANFTFSASMGPLPTMPAPNPDPYLQLSVRQNWNDDIAFSVGYRRCGAAN